jgi:SAM-dependent methyltransferase
MGKVENGPLEDEADRIVLEYKRRRRDLRGRYTITRPENIFIRQVRERVLIGLLARSGRLPLADARILDVGCGGGQLLVDFETWGAARGNLAGIDLIPERVERARARLTAERDERGTVVAPGAEIVAGDASVLPWPDGSFDLVCQSIVFSSILDEEMRARIAREMARVLAPGGAVVWYDFFVDNPRNPNVRGVRAGEVAALFPGFRMRRRRVTLLPPLSRRLVPRSRLAAELLHELRVLNTHLLALLER